MSYSRWSNSVWYTFWCSSGSDKRDEQLFSICGVTIFTYADLKQGLDICIDKIKNIVIEIKNKDNESSIGIFEYSEDDYDELKVYMKRFIKDVEEEYPL